MTLTTATTASRVTTKLRSLVLLALALLLTLLVVAPDAEARSKNTRPTARTDYYSLNEDTSLRVGKSGGVLKNDSDRQSKYLSAKLSRAPYNGRVSLARDGSFLYTPNKNFNGRDSFSYRACETSGSRRLCSNKTVAYFGVRAVNDAPIANDDRVQTAEDTTITIPASGILSNDTDPDGDRLKVMGAAAKTAPSNGTVTIGEDGNLVYKPRANFTGTDTFSYQATDGKAVDTAVVTVSVASVNDAPVARYDKYMTRMNTTKVVGAPGVLANDYDADGDKLRVVGHGQSPRGKVSMSGAGGFYFKPNKDFKGWTSFRYYISDPSGARSSQIVSIRVF